MKNIICRKSIMIIIIVITIFATTSLAIPTASSAKPINNTPDYFREFRIPLEVIADPMYERMQIVRTAEYVAYHSPFAIIPTDLFLIAKHELQMLESAEMLHYFDRR